MTAFRTKLKKVFLLLSSAILLSMVFVLDIIKKSVDIDSDILTFVRNLAIIAAFGFMYVLIESLWKREQGPSKKLGFALVLSLVVATTVILLAKLADVNFEAKNLTLLPLDYASIVISTVLGLLFGTALLIILLTLRDVILSKQRKGTRRNFLVFIGLMLATVLSTLFVRPLESFFITSVFFGLSIAGILVISFRLSWIVYLSKREKLFSMVYGFLLFGLFIGVDIALFSSSAVNRSLVFYSRQLTVFSSIVSMFATIYFGMTFLSTLFHLPTAEAFDRKISEVASLHNLSRLVTQVFDFNELVESVTRMTLDVCQAKSSWLEIIVMKHNKQGLRPIFGKEVSGVGFDTVALKNISLEETYAISPLEGESVRTFVYQTRKAVVIDNVEQDRWTKHLTKKERNFGSLVVVPLVSHDSLIGILYATKDLSYGFDREDVDVISAFADQATIAIENSRLIEKSLERERLVREMVVAQDMQKKLLPQRLPSLKELEIEALSTPAFEVGGDYYDFTMLDDHHLAVIVGDVSGKGVPAAFYMAEMKGVFQSLSKIYKEPRQFLSRAHAALLETMDRRTFISVIYAVLDLRSGEMTVARAGHCPMLYIAEDRAVYVQPKGMGLGMGDTKYFEQTIAQESITMRCGDAVVFFTDGVTEARPPDGEEFGYDRLLEVCRSARHISAEGIRDAIVMAVDKHMNHQSPEDDLTIVALKWLKHH